MVHRCGLLAVAGMPGVPPIVIDIPAQAAVGTSGRTTDLVCGVKPVAVLAALGALDAEGLASPSTPLTRSGAASATLGDLLSHRVSLMSPSAFDFLNASDASRVEYVKSILAQDPCASSETEYLDLALLVVLNNMLIAFAGIDVASAVDRLADSLGLKHTFLRRAGLDPSQVRVQFDYSQESSIPMLHTRTVEFTDSTWNPFVGGYSSPRDLFDFYRNLHDLLHGSEIAGFPRPDVVARYFDNCSQFSMGLMLDLQSRGLTECGPRAVGHLGFMRSTLGFTDRATGFTFAAVCGGIDFSSRAPYIALWNSIVGFARSNACSSR